MAERFGVLKSEGGKLISVKTQRVVCISINGITDTLGTYKSKERCIEIIEEIFKLCGSYIYSSGSSGYIKGELPYPPMAADIPRIYQMPEE